MIRLRTASALAAGTVAALALGGTAALAAGGDDPSAPASVEMLPDGTVVTPSPSSSSPTAEPDPSPSASSSSPTSSPSPSASASSPSSAGAISLDAAKAIAIKAAGGGRVTDIERDTEHGRAVWDVEVRKGAVEHDIDVDRATGDVLRHKSEADDDRGSRGRDDHDSDDHDSDDRDDRWDD